MPTTSSVAARGSRDGGCPSDEEWADLIAALGDGKLSPERRRSLHQHLDGCQACAELFDGLIQTYFDGLDDVGATVPGAQRDYQLVEVIGRGGMGVVYRARDRRLGRDVAIKVLHGDDGDGARRLLAEARAMAAIDHPNVVRVFDIGAWGERSFVAMELIDGPNLRQWLLAEPRSARAIVAAVRDAGRGLIEAHRLGLIHRDFKPDNVFVGGDGRVCVGDFGMVGGPGRSRTRSADTEIDESLRTRTGAAVGTIGYMAPEQLDGGEYDARADQYAWCVTLWEALAGVRPFAGKTIAALRDAQARPPAVPEAIDPRIARVLLRGLAEDPARRWPDMRSLLDELGRSRRRWRPVAAVALALGVTAAWMTAGPSQPESIASAEGGPVEPAIDDIERAGIREGVHLRDTGRLEEARARADRLLEDAERHSPGAGARALWLRGTVRIEQGDIVGAVDDLNRSAFAAEEVHDRETVVDAATALMIAHGTFTDRDDEFERWNAVARTWLARQPDPLREARRLSALGMSHRRHLRLLEARDAHAAAVLLLLAAGPDDEELFIARMNLAGVTAELGDLDGARASIRSAMVGATTPPGSRRRLAALMGLADIDRAAGDLDRAITTRREVIAALAGTRTDLLASAHYNLGAELAQRGDYDEAARELELASDQWRDLTGPSSRMVALVERTLGQLALLRGHGDEARRRCERARVTDEVSMAEDDPDRLASRWCLARAAILVGDGRRAHGLLDGLLSAVATTSGEACQFTIARAQVFELVGELEAARATLLEAEPVCVANLPDTEPELVELRAKLAAGAQISRRSDRRATGPAGRRE